MKIKGNTKMKKFILTMSFVLTVLAILTIVSAAASVYDANENEYSATNEDVFYLPSHIKPSNVTVEENGAKKQIDLTDCQSTDKKGNLIYRYDLEGFTYTFYFANNLPSIYLTTSLSLEQILGEARERDQGVKMFITDKDGVNFYYDKPDTVSEIKVRGNTTDDYKKQPFQIKLDKKHDLFGMGEAKTWILLANYLDQSNIRNSVMYKIGELLGIDTCSFQSIDLYINGEYYGIYLLCEKVQIHSQRVNIFDLEEENELLNPKNYGFTRKKTSGTLIDETIITEYQYVRNMENPADISGGYLIELDNNYYKDEKCYFKTANGNAYVIKSPEYASQEQVEYIARVFAEMEEAIYSPTGKNGKGIHYSQYADVESLAYAYILQELGRNWDAGSSSMYFYKDKDVDGKFTKIVKGPLWDCDNTLGNMLKNNANNTNGYWAKNRKLWVGLTQHDYFNYVVAREFARIYPQLIEMTEKDGYISQLVEEIGTSIVMERARWNSDDYEFWPMYGDYVYKDIHYDKWQSSQTFQFIDGEYSNGVDNDETTVIGYLNTHIVNRSTWLLKEWAYSEENTVPSISVDGIIDNTLKLPVAPSFAPVNPEQPTDSNVGTTDTNIDTNTDTIIDTDTNADVTTDSITDTNINTDNIDNTNSSNSNNDKATFIVIAVAVAVIACGGIIGSLLVIRKLKK